MKTIEQAAKEYAIKQIDELGIEYESDICKETDIKVSISDFKAGVKFAQHWIDVDDELPECNIKGEDGVMLSETVLIKVKNNNDMPVVAIYIKVDDDEFFETLGVKVQQKRITHWRPIELK